MNKVETLISNMDVAYTVVGWTTVGINDECPAAGYHRESHEVPKVRAAKILAATAKSR